MDKPSTFINYKDYRIDFSASGSNVDVAIYRIVGSGGMGDMRDEFESILKCVGKYEMVIGILSGLIKDIGFQIQYNPPKYIENIPIDIKPASHPDDGTEGWYNKVKGSLVDVPNLINNSIKWKRIQDNKGDIQTLISAIRGR